ncbi:pyridoxamine 5'-phosphate oxidase family protein [Actinobacteria bacterium YIM 96077]|uniref:Pyridoxamine 5'-phosphate oxidase family protein n=1 Tax=Phytoactinopolyspora halophila TaxID=1981511 RepID=A0A329QRT4_9ACTN|nr:pyridoxamine 5'-phosphate oxidase family protein [Phytoactinopolyspora halophila]AYY14254.1 pyridoxamine 5'-phosphate oxidase family protein [Actinobacteria bacterium YIM 96077]RAW14796.1 pyridoxamine 5'-phosphate oxidase family protein [Phytoactinopolyspora halophila]
MTGERQMVPMDRYEALSLLGSVSMGRVVFTDQALPAIRPVNHLVDGNGGVIIRTHVGSAISSLVHASGSGVVLAFEADDIDQEKHTGWSVVVTGMASLVEDAEAVSHYEHALRSWVNYPMDQIIRIQPDLVTGYWLTADGSP